MINYIILKEIKSYLLNRSMVFTWALIIGLFVINTYFSTFQYTDLYKKYEDIVKENHQILEFDTKSEYGQRRDIMSHLKGQMMERVNSLYDLSQLTQKLANPPSSLLFMSGASEGLVPDGTTMNVFTEPKFHSFAQNNPYVNAYFSIDWTNVMIYVISFLCICFSYNVFSGEKEDGTLKLMLSNNVSRLSIIIAKFLGLLVVFIIPILLGILISCILLEMTPSIEMSFIDYTKTAYFFFVSILLICITILTGFLVSALTQKSYVSLILCLVCWTLMVVIIPNTSWIITQFTDKIPPESNILKEEEQQIDALQDCFSGWNGEWNNPPVRKEVYDRKDCIDRQTNVHNDIWSNYNNMQLEQTRKSILLSKISPFGLFRFLGDHISNNNYFGYTSFFKQVKMYQITFKEYIINKDKADPQSQHLYWNESLAEAFGSQQKASIEEIPKFRKQSPTITELMGDTLGDLVLLCFWIIILFILSTVAFLKYDVR